MDGISAHFLLDQIRAHYSGRPFVTAPVQFSDYSAAMTEEGHALAYDDWMRLIDRSASVLPDALAKDRESIPKAWIRVLPFELSPDVTAAVGTLCRTFACTRFEALAVATELYFRRDDDRPASVGVLHGGRRGPRSLEVAGLLRTQVMDVVQMDGSPTAGAAFTAQLGSLRAALRHLARLPVEEVCRRAGLPGGFRFGERRLWEVSIISRFSRFLTGPFGEAAIEPLDAPMRDDWFCENGGPVFSVNFTLGKGALTGGLQYVDPPVDPGTAAAVVAGIQQTVLRVAGDPAASVASAPAFLRLVS
ncbi:condensation domain-containing protein [Actinacidiphila rubida]|nr:hypothetical protein [Actinacidiphila rubida]